MHLTYTFFYYMAAGLGLASAPLLFYKFGKNGFFTIKNFVILIICVTYLGAMFRQSGVDHSGYAYSYYNDQFKIPDIGFATLTFCFNLLGLPFEVFKLLVGTVNLLSLRRSAKYFSISFTPLFILYFLHLAVIRDFAQLRIGFAISLAILGAISSGKAMRLVLYLFAGSIHLTSLIFILSYEFCRRLALIKSQKKQIIAILGSLLGIYFIGSIFQYIGFIDPRIESYLSWEEEGYGLPVGQFLILYFHVFVLALAYTTRASWLVDVKIRTLVFLQILGLAVFIAFIDTSIFAFRLSSATLSFYPVLIVFSLSHIRLLINNYSISKILASVVFLLVGAVLILRTESFEILSSINFGD